MRRPDPFQQIRPAVQEANARVIELRRDLHAHPELSWEEHRTQGVILEELQRLGLKDVRPIAKTGGTGLIEGKHKGPTILWRADVDALPIPEKSNEPFASKNENVMHACGHDAHIAIALGIASVLMDKRDSLRGNVRFVFQPAEEECGGALACIADGVLDTPKVERVLGLHISADIGLGQVNVMPGPFFAAPTAFELEIRGRGGHAAAPHQTIDSVVVAAHVITALQTVVSRSVGPIDTGVLTVGKVESGFRGNVVAESATMHGTIRSYTQPVLDVLLERTEAIIAGVCTAFGAEYSFTYNTSCPPVVNDEDVTALVKEQATEFFGEHAISGAPSMGADDMSDFLAARPGCYFWLGARNEPKGIAGRHHDPGFVIDEAALPLGVEFGTRLIERSLA